jgi:hypothetical protein
MRSLFAVTAVLVGASALVVAQQQPKQFKVKPSPSDSPSAQKSTTAPPAKAPASGSSSSSTKNLDHLERQTAKSASSHANKKAPKAVALKPEKGAVNKPMNFGGKGSDSGMNRQAANPYKGRLKQKGTGRH